MHIFESNIFIAVSTPFQVPNQYILDSLNERIKHFTDFYAFITHLKCIYEILFAIPSKRLDALPRSEILQKGEKDCEHEQNVREEQNLLNLQDNLVDLVNRKVRILGLFWKNHLIKVKIIKIPNSVLGLVKKR